MKQKEFEEKIREASKEMLKKKAPTTPQTQFIKGALCAWNLLMSAHSRTYYEDVLRADVLDREGKVEHWKESLIMETAKMMERRDRIEDEIAKTGDLITKTDKNMNRYQESNPLHIHLKELDRTIGMQREHLGLSNKVNPVRMKDSPKVVEKEGALGQILNSLSNIT